MSGGTKYTQDSAKSGDMYLNIADCNSSQSKITNKVSYSYFETLCLGVDNKQTEVLIINNSSYEY